MQKNKVLAGVSTFYFASKCLTQSLGQIENEIVAWFKSKSEIENLYRNS